LCRQNYFPQNNYLYSSVEVSQRDINDCTILNHQPPLKKHSTTSIQRLKIFFFYQKIIYEFVPAFGCLRKVLIPSVDPEQFGVREFLVAVRTLDGLGNVPSGHVRVQVALQFALEVAEQARELFVLVGVALPDVGVQLRLVEEHRGAAAVRLAEEILGRMPLFEVGHQAAFLVARRGTPSAAELLRRFNLKKNSNINRNCRLL